MKALSNHSQITMSSLEIAELTGKRHAHVVRDIGNMLEELGQPKIGFSSTYRSAQGKALACYNLPRDLTLTLVTGYSIPIRHKINQRWIELESKQAFALPDFTNPAEAARAWADERERADFAIKTKAEIGSRREATAMATASKAVRKLSALKREQDRKRIYCTIRRATVMHPGRQFNWRVLKSASMGMELPTIDVDDDLYGTVKAYHADVWLACYGLDVMNREEL